MTKSCRSWRDPDWSYPRRTRKRHIFRASQVKDVVSDDLVERIDAANRLYLQAYARNARMMAILEQVGTFDDYFRQLTRDMREVFVDRNTRGIERLQREGLADPHLDARATAHVLGGMTEHFAYLWLGLGQSFDEEVAMATLTRVWAQAIGLTLPDWDASARSEAAAADDHPAQGSMTPPFSAQVSIDGPPCRGRAGVQHLIPISDSVTLALGSPGHYVRGGSNDRL